MKFVLLFFTLFVVFSYCSAKRLISGEKIYRACLLAKEMRSKGHSCRSVQRKIFNYLASSITAPVAAAVHTLLGPPSPFYGHYKPRPLKRPYKGPRRPGRGRKRPRGPQKHPRGPQKYPRGPQKRPPSKPNSGKTGKLSISAKPNSTNSNEEAKATKLTEEASLLNSTEEASLMNSTELASSDGQKLTTRLTNPFIRSQADHDILRSVASSIDTISTPAHICVDIGPGPPLNIPANQASVTKLPFGFQLTVVGKPRIDLEIEWPFAMVISKQCEPAQVAISHYLRRSMDDMQREVNGFLQKNSCDHVPRNAVFDLDNPQQWRQFLEHYTGNSTAAINERVKILRSEGVIKDCKEPVIQIDSPTRN